MGELIFFFFLGARHSKRACRRSAVVHSLKHTAHQKKKKKIPESAPVVRLVRRLPCAYTRVRTLLDTLCRRDRYRDGHTSNLSTRTYRYG